MASEYIIGVDIGGTNIRIGAGPVGGGALEAFVKASSQQVLGGDAVENLIRFIRDYIASELSGQAVCCIVVGLPSTVNAERDRVVQTPNIAGLDDVPLKRLMEAALGIEVLLERDVNLLLCHDAERLELDMAGVNVGVYVGTGIGNAIFLDGLPYLGADGAAGELGHIYIGRKGKICGCGNEGCAECYAGGKHLVELRDERFPGEDIGGLFENHADDAALVEFVDTVASVTATEINILNPRAVVMGGGVLNMPGFPKDMLVRAIHHYCRKPYPERTLRVLFSEDGSENGVKGAIAYARLRLGAAK